MNKKINKTDLVKLVAKRTERTQEDISNVVDALFEVMQKEITNGNVVQVLGFGQFDIINRRSRNATNPRTGELIKLPERKSVRFKSGTMLRVK